MPVQSSTHYDIPKTQNAIVFEEQNGPLMYKTDWPVVQPNELKPGEVLVRIAYSGVCHTDLHAWLGDWPLDNKLPLVGGHEGSGYVAAIADHTNTTLKVGDAVGVKWLADSCLACENCRRTEESNCQEAKNHGFGVDGSFQQWCVSYANHLTKIPDGFPLDAAAPILCAGVTVYKAIKNIGGNPGDVVVVPGAGGGLGHLACQYAIARGYRVIAIDSGNDKRELVKSYGINEFIDYQSEDIVARVKELTDGHGAHGAIIVASGAKAYEQALDYLRPKGVLVCVGLPPNGEIKVDVFFTVFKQLQIKGSYVGNRQDSIEAIDIAARGKVKTAYKVEKLSNLPDVFKRMKDLTLVGRVVLDCE